MSNYLNVFNSFKSKSNYHEDELTRTFLSILKNIPIIQAMFIDMIRDEMIEKKCEEIIPSITKQDSQISYISTQISNTNSIFSSINGRRVVSIVISDDKLYTDIKVVNSERSARYDGVIIYDPSWVLIVENKPSAKNIWPEQLNPNINSNLEDVEIEQEVISLSWRVLLENLGKLINKGALVGLEKTLVEDFLQFVDMQFPQLNSYTNLALCKDNKYLLEKRCIAIMEEINIGEVKYHRGGSYHIQIDNYSVRQIALSPKFNGDDWEIMLHIYPGDSMSQARTLYNSININKLLDMIDENCTIQPNMHFAFRASNLLWTEVGLSTKDYIEYWTKDENTLKQIQRSDFKEYFCNLNQDGILSELDLDIIDDKIMSKGYPNLNICPGIAIKYKWSKEESINLDMKSKFSETIKSKIKEIMNALGESI